MKTWKSVEKAVARCAKLNQMIAVSIMEVAAIATETILIPLYAVWKDNRAEFGNAVTDALTLAGFDPAVVEKPRISEYWRVLGAFPSAEILTAVSNEQKRILGKGEKRMTAFSLIRRMAAGIETVTDANGQKRIKATTPSKAVNKGLAKAKAATARLNAAKAAKAAATPTAATPTAATAQGHATAADDPIAKALERIRREALLYIATQGHDQQWLDTVLETVAVTIQDRRAVIDARNDSAADNRKAVANKANAKAAAATAAAAAAKAAEMPPVAATAEQKAKAEKDKAIGTAKAVANKANAKAAAAKAANA